jgi:hypothetical protein
MMHALSIWNPWATLIVYRHKAIETRGYPAPRFLVGQRIAIASTKSIRPPQRLALTEAVFAEHYQAIRFPALEALSNGFVLGTARLAAIEPITDELIAGLSTKERAFGWYELGRWAWHLDKVRRFKTPYPARGGQGFWIWDHHVATKSHRHAG